MFNKSVAGQDVVEVPDVKMLVLEPNEMICLEKLCDRYGLDSLELLQSKEFSDAMDFVAAKDCVGRLRVGNYFSLAITALSINPLISMMYVTVHYGVTAPDASVVKEHIKREKRAMRMAEKQFPSH